MRSCKIFDKSTISEAPCYRPRYEEFLDPLLYIKSIASNAEKFGICKIIPPRGWKPDFARTPDKLKFQTKKQDLSMLDGSNRQSYNFDRILRIFMFEAGNPLPSKQHGKTIVALQDIDLYTLHHAVEALGGLNGGSSKKFWDCLTKNFGFHRDQSSELQHFYIKYVKPFVSSSFFKDLFESGGNTNNATNSAKAKKIHKVEKIRKHNHVRNGTGFWVYRVEYSKCIWGVVRCTPQQSLKVEYYLECFQTNSSSDSFLFSENISKATLSDLVANGGDPIQAELVYSGQMCEICGIASDPIDMMGCDGCDCFYHSNCLAIPSLEWNSRFDWFCNTCCLGAKEKPQFGFTFGGIYSLQDFISMGNKWRSNYLTDCGLPSNCSEEEIEREYWELVGPDPPKIGIKPLYGSDLDTSIVGSGFQSENLVLDEENVVELKSLADPWNLNFLPVSKRSLLQFMGHRVTGVSVPWLYIGSMFSSFCWHNEDHHLYSINYHHFGEPKQWYAIPGSFADQFESLARSKFPHLFVQHPDLLYHLVTMINPSVVASHSIPVCSTTQRSGEFIITFPRAYHAGFNLGVNCAEAVNFALPDWLPYGFHASESLRLFSRPTIFSHDGLVIKLAEMIIAKGSLGEIQLETLANDKVCKVLCQELKRIKDLLSEDEAIVRVEPMSSFFERVNMRSSRHDSSSNSVGIKDDLTRGPRCLVCQIHCYIAVIICEECTAKRGIGKRATSCSRHSEKLCACPTHSRIRFIRTSVPVLNQMEADLKLQMKCSTLKKQKRKGEASELACKNRKYRTRLCVSQK